MTDAICKEAALRSGYINENVSTIYFGGGTPSLIPASELQLLMNTLGKLFFIEPDAEITLEANPDDISKQKLNEWKSAGINRLSIGVQSFFEEDLQWMNRAHNAHQALDSVTLAQQEGFNNITIDLIYGTPTLTDRKWKENIDIALSLNVSHLSCYALTVEQKTALADMIRKHTIANVNADDQSRQFDLLMDWLANAGYEHYEISNFAKPGFRSKHNSSYWQGKNYIGLGPSAHSFNGSSRQWNIANNALYLQSLQQNNLSFEIEKLTPAQHLNEYIMTSLRTIEGLDLSTIEKKWSAEKMNYLKKGAEKFMQQQLLKFSNNHLVLTQKGKHFADGIAADLFILE